MAVTSAFSGLASGKMISYSPVSGLDLSTFPRKTCQLDNKNKKANMLSICPKPRIDKYYQRSLPVVLSMSNSSDGLGPLPPSDTIKQFYASINEKNLKQLSNSISDDCFFDDASFLKPFQGKKEVMHFLEQLTATMGHNLEFNIGHVCEGDNFTVGVTWHLEWKKNPVPFSRGCSFCECSKQGSTLLIKKAQVFNESPIKPGGIALSLLKIVTTLFDAFPEAAERFLKSPHVVVQLFLRIYNVALRPFITPILGFYIKIWNFIARLLTYTLNILIYISKNLNKNK